MRKFAVSAAVAVLSVIVGNALYVTVPAYLEKSKDPRNSTVSMIAHLRWGLDPTTVVIDLLNVDGTASMADVDRCLWDVAEGLDNRTFSSAQLAYRGIAKFQMEGAYFKQMGEQREWQNPIYVIRTMPQNLQKMDGEQAFPTWTGGWLGVMNKQMEDHTTFHREWYVD